MPVLLKVQQPWGKVISVHPQFLKLLLGSVAVASSEPVLGGDEWGPVDPECYQCYYGLQTRRTQGLLWGRTQPGYEAKVDISLHSHNRIHVVRASANIARTRGPIAAGVCVCLWRDGETM